MNARKTFAGLILMAAAHTLAPAPVSAEAADSNQQSATTMRPQTPFKQAPLIRQPVEHRPALNQVTARDGVAQTPFKQSPRIAAPNTETVGITRPAGDSRRGHIVLKQLTRLGNQGHAAAHDG